MRIGGNRSKHAEDDVDDDEGGGSQRRLALQ
jgi:hypothetical protein